MEFMPQHAPVVLLALMLICFVLGVAAIAIIGAWAMGYRDWAKKILAGAAVAPGVYFAVLLAFSLTSQEKVLRPGEQKYLCEVDCHEAYSVLDVSTTKTVGAFPNQANAHGTFYVVTVKVWFDEGTISSHRGLRPLTPNSHEAFIIDDTRRECNVSAEGQAAIDRVQGTGLPFTRPLRPGESYTTKLVFDLPSDIRNPRLYITTEPAFTQFLIGHENSFFHKKVFFQIEPQKEHAGKTAASRVSG